MLNIIDATCWTAHKNDLDICPFFTWTKRRKKIVYNFFVQLKHKRRKNKKTLKPNKWQTLYTHIFFCLFISYYNFVCVISVRKWKKKHSQKKNYHHFKKLFLLLLTGHFVIVEWDIRSCWIQLLMKTLIVLNKYDLFMLTVDMSVFFQLPAEWRQLFFYRWHLPFLFIDKFRSNVG